MRETHDQKVINADDKDKARAHVEATPTLKPTPGSKANASSDAQTPGEPLEPTRK